MQKILFMPNKGETSSGHWFNGHHACNKSITMILAEHTMPDDRHLPEPGYRFIETKNDPASASFDHGRATTHTRLSAWVVTKTEEYPSNIEGMQRYTQIVVCYCDYKPLPESENPWVETEGKPIISPDSFGGDYKRFQEHVSTMSPEQKEKVEIYDPQSV